MSMTNILNALCRFIPYHWIGDEDVGALVNLKSGRLIGHYERDNRDRWHIWVCLPYWRARRVIRREPAGYAGMAAFPRCWVWLFHAKDQPSAKLAIERFSSAREFAREDLRS